MGPRCDPCESELECVELDGFSRLWVDSIPESVWMLKSPEGEVLWVGRATALLEIIGAGGLSPKLIVGSLWRVAGEGRGLL